MGPSLLTGNAQSFSSHDCQVSFIPPQIDRDNSDTYYWWNLLPSFFYTFISPLTLTITHTLQLNWRTDVAEFIGLTKTDAFKFILWAAENLEMKLTHNPQEVDESNLHEYKVLFFISITQPITLLLKLYITYLPRITRQHSQIATLSSPPLLYLGMVHWYLPHIRHHIRFLDPLRTAQKQHQIR